MKHSARHVSIQSTQGSSTNASSDVPSETLSADTLSKWFEALQRVQRQSNGSDHFLQSAVHALVDPGGLEGGAVVVPQDQQWQTVCCHSLDGNPFVLDRELLDQVWSQGEPIAENRSRSLSVIAVPVFDSQAETAAVLYGVRQLSKTNRRRTIRRLEALWVQLVAEALTAGIVRQMHEATGARRDALLTQVLPPDVVRQWLKSDGELSSERREVSILFADIVQSSRLCEASRADAHGHRVRDVLELMTATVLDNEGVIVDTYGDGLLAMWNAPNDQPDHAVRACQTALQIAACQDKWNAQRADDSQPTLQIANGIHTGWADVGNSGSRHCIKYGPTGLVVYYAHRIERVTRWVKQDIVISDATRRQLPTDIAAYELGKFKLWKLEQPLTLHALHRLGTLGCDVNACCRRRYHEVMQLLSSGRLTEAADRLDECQGCQLDELPFDFLAKQLRAHISGVDSQINNPLVFDLAQSTSHD